MVFMLMYGFYIDSFICECIVSRLMFYVNLRLDFILTSFLGVGGILFLENTIKVETFFFFYVIP